MEFKKLIIVLSITITVTMGIMFGVSYGWYAYSNAETTAIGNTNKTAPTVIFAQTEYIFLSQTMPIYDEDRYNYANKNSFTVTVGENLRMYDVGIEISLRDIRMSDELKITNYKYELLQDGKVVNDGDFSTIGANTTLRLMPMTVLSTTAYPKTYTYELYIWLSEDESDQNYLMNKGFSAKINVSSAIKRTEGR